MIKVLNINIVKKNCTRVHNNKTKLLFQNIFVKRINQMLV